MTALQLIVIVCLMAKDERKNGEEKEGARSEGRESFLQVNQRSQRVFQILTKNNMTITIPNLFPIESGKVTEVRGKPGVGKTQLVMRVAGECAARGGDVVIVGIVF